MSALKTPKKPTLDRDGSESLALQALGYLAQDPKRLTRFFALTGLAPGDLADAGDSPALQAAFLDYLLRDESELLAFAANSGVAAETISVAHRILSGDGA